MEIRPTNNWNLDYSVKTEGKNLKNNNENAYDLDIEVNLQERSDSSANLINDNRDPTYPNSQCICSGIHCGGTVCSHC